MVSIKKIYSEIIHPKLSKAVKESTQIVEKYKNETVFHSKTMKEILSEKFTYRGNKPNTIYLKSAKTKQPVEAKVLIKVEKDSHIKDFYHETYQIRDLKGGLIGEKTFSIQKQPNNTYQMFGGFMETMDNDYLGVGIRLDQLQIERALQLGIKSIPRESLAEAVIYHTKMGFLPIQKDLVQVDKIKDMPKLTKQTFQYACKDIPINQIKPIVVNKNGKFYIDVNMTQTITNMEESKRLLKKDNLYRINHIESDSSFLALSGKELDYWKEMIEGHEILPKLDFDLPIPLH